MYCAVNLFKSAMYWWVSIIQTCRKPRLMRFRLLCGELSRWLLRCRTSAGDTVPSPRCVPLQRPLWQGSVVVPLSSQALRFQYGCTVPLLTRATSTFEFSPLSLVSQAVTCVSSGSTLSGYLSIQSSKGIPGLKPWIKRCAVSLCCALCVPPSIRPPSCSRPPRSLPACVPHYRYFVLDVSTKQLKRYHSAEEASTISAVSRATPFQAVSGVSIKPPDKKNTTFQFDVRFMDGEALKLRACSGAGVLILERGHGAPSLHSPVRVRLAALECRIWAASLGLATGATGQNRDDIARVRTGNLAFPLGSPRSPFPQDNIVQ